MNGQRVAGEFSTATASTTKKTGGCLHSSRDFMWRKTSDGPRALYCLGHSWPVLYVVAPRRRLVGHGQSDVGLRWRHLRRQEVPQRWNRPKSRRGIAGEVFPAGPMQRALANDHPRRQHPGWHLRQRGLSKWRARSSARSCWPVMVLTQGQGVDGNLPSWRARPDQSCGRRARGRERTRANRGPAIGNNCSHKHDAI
jgi:hypothetical protein